MDDEEDLDGEDEDEDGDLEEAEESFSLEGACSSGVTGRLK